MKNFKLILIAEVFCLTFLLFSTKKFFENRICKNIELEVTGDEYEIVQRKSLEEFFTSLKGQKMESIDSYEIAKKIKESHVIDKVNIFKKNQTLAVQITPHKILGLAYYNFPQENKKNLEFILDDGDLVEIKSSKVRNVIPVILEQADLKIEKFLPVLNFINQQEKLKAILNSISLKDDEIFITTILNDCLINLGSVLEQDFVFNKIKKICTLIALGDKFPYMELSDEAVFLRK